MCAGPLSATAMRGSILALVLCRVDQGSLVGRGLNCWRRRTARGHTAVLTSALHQGADQCGSEIDGNRIADLLGDFGLIAGEFVCRLRIREAHCVGQFLWL